MLQVTAHLRAFGEEDFMAAKRAMEPMMQEAMAHVGADQDRMKSFLIQMLDHVHQSKVLSVNPR